VPVTKKTRFEVFKRDGFRCCYCGKSPPEVLLEVDHIEPKKRGGKDDIENLITACFDCNRGKGAIPLDKAPLQLVENVQILKEREEQLKEFRKLVARVEKRILGDMEDIEKIYEDQYNGWRFSDQFRNASLKNFLKKLPKHEVEEALWIAISKHPSNRNEVIRYFCGVCWNKIRERY
jgi:hypothetical protein